MLKGKQYDRGVRGIRLVTEALSHLRNKSAEKWAIENRLPWITESTEQSLEDLKYSVKSLDNEIMVYICKDMEDDLVKVHETLEKFRSVRKQHHQHLLTGIALLRGNCYYDLSELNEMQTLTFIFPQLPKQYHISY